MYNVLKLNEISKVAVDVFTDSYSLVKEADKPDAIVLRSFNMHEYDIPESVLCVGRAGAGVNNIPLDKCAEKGIVVFNTPGANANAVKELVLCGLLLAGRKVVDGINWASTLKGKGAEVGKLVEKGKSSFVGHEITGKTLGVVGLGAIGVLVANAATALGMNVIGYDPFLSDNAKSTLDASVKTVTDLTEIFTNSDFITLHVPLNDSTRGMINESAIAKMKDGAAVLNFSRGELADAKAVIAALEAGKLERYVTDFPSDEMLNVPNVVAIPHLGASTPEAEDNCAVMVARQMMDYIENGNITNSVNMAPVRMDRSGACRITIFLNNTPWHEYKFVELMIKELGIKAINVRNANKGNYSYLIVDAKEKPSDEAIAKLAATEGVIKVRVL